MDFSYLNLPIYDGVYKLPLEVQKNIYEYLASMDDMQKIAYAIASNHLGSSFNILKSVGYLEWLQNKKN